MGFLGGGTLCAASLKFLPASLGSRPRRDWRPEFEWLDLLPVNELQRLPASQFLPVEYFGSLKKVELIERLLEHWPDDAGVPKVFELAPP